VGDLIGYARVSTDDQNLQPQLDALQAAGCRRVFEDVGSGSLKHRPQLDACLDFLTSGHTLVVWRLDRLGRGLRHLIELVERLDGEGVACGRSPSSWAPAAPAAASSSTCSPPSRSSTAT
jgi:DNA invertase Pin-like site-specific DNA recombinase